MGVNKKLLECNAFVQIKRNQQWCGKKIGSPQFTGKRSMRERTSFEYPAGPEGAEHSNNSTSSVKTFSSPSFSIFQNWTRSETMLSEWAVQWGAAGGGCQFISYSPSAPSPPFHPLLCDAGAAALQTTSVLYQFVPCWILPIGVLEGDWKAGGTEEMCPPCFSPVDFCRLVVLVSVAPAPLLHPCSGSSFHSASQSRLHFLQNLQDQTRRIHSFTLKHDCVLATSSSESGF